MEKNRVTSFIHSIFAACLALWLAPAYYRPLLEMRAGILWRPGSALENTFLSISLGYLFYDLLLGLLFAGVNPPGIVAHHLASIALIASSFSFGGVPVGCLMMLHEVSVPFTNLNGFLDKKSPLRVPNGLLVREHAAPASRPSLHRAVVSPPLTRHNPLPPHHPSPPITDGAVLLLLQDSCRGPGLEGNGPRARHWERAGGHARCASTAAGGNSNPGGAGCVLVFPYLPQNKQGGQRGGEGKVTAPA